MNTILFNDACCPFCATEGCLQAAVQSPKNLLCVQCDRQFTVAEGNQRMNQVVRQWREVNRDVASVTQPSIKVHAQPLNGKPVLRS